MKKNKIRTPERLCVGCRELKDKKALIRVIKTPDGIIEIDITTKKNGRGVYVCKQLECIEKAEKTKAFEKALKTTIGKDVYDSIKGETEDG